MKDGSQASRVHNNGYIWISYNASARVQYIYRFPFSVVFFLYEFILFWLFCFRCPSFALALHISCHRRVCVNALCVLVGCISVSENVQKWLPPSIDGFLIENDDNLSEFGVAASAAPAMGPQLKNEPNQTSFSIAFPMCAWILLNHKRSTRHV